MEQLDSQEKDQENSTRKERDRAHGHTSMTHPGAELCLTNILGGSLDSKVDTPADLQQLVTEVGKIC